MKTRIAGIAVVACLLLMSACNKTNQGYTELELKRKADSILQIRYETLRRQAKEDLDRRLPIELKPKVDSLRNRSYLLPPVPRLEGAPTGFDSAAGKAGRLDPNKTKAPKASDTMPEKS